MALSVEFFSELISSVFEKMKPLKMIFGRIYWQPSSILAMTFHASALADRAVFPYQTIPRSLNLHNSTQ